jgi:dihydroorotate dehydrogenase
MILSPLSGLLRIGRVEAFGREALAHLNPELAHRATVTALSLGLVPAQEEADPPELAGEICGLAFSNPIGMAAGFDKNAEAPRALAAMGFGLVEVGTLTPRPQQGNAKPRLFRLPKADAVINRMGFNNDGHLRALERLRGVRVPGLLGVNIGANKDSADFVADYVAGVTTFADHADYLTVNISSPNTPGLRNLQADEALKRLLGEVLAARAKAKIRVPVLLKIAPDLDETALDGIARVVLATDLDGLIVSNTTLGREGVTGLDHATETGGLSGKPLFALSTRRLAQMRQRVGTLPIIGVGGVHSPETALAKLEAGADAIQLYTALVYEGPGLVTRIKAGLVDAVRAAGVGSVAGLVGRSTADWAEGRLG